MSYHIRSWPSLAAGLIFSGITAWTLLADVLAGASLTPAHAMSAGAILAAIASGLAAWPQLRRGAIVQAFLLCILFVASTTYVIIASASRNAETSATKAARIAETNKARQRELDALTASERAMQTTQAQLQAGCVTQNKLSKSQCDGLRSTMAGLEPAIRGYKATLRDLGPELAPNGGYRTAAETIAALPGIQASPAAIEERLVLILPFLAVLVAELGTIVFFHLSFGHSRAKAGPQARETRQALTFERPLTDAEIEELRRKLQSLGGRVEMQDDLARHLKIHKGEVSKRVAKAVKAGVVRQEKNGRQNAIVLNTLH